MELLRDKLPHSQAQQQSIIAGDVTGGLICNTIPKQTIGLSVEHTHQYTQEDQHMGVVDRRGRS